MGFMEMIYRKYGIDMAFIWYGIYGNGMGTIWDLCTEYLIWGCCGVYRNYIRCLCERTAWKLEIN